jgi:hypothetical protein
MSKPEEVFVNISLGNDAMLTSYDVARALRKIAERLEDNQYLEQDDMEVMARGIMDDNGLTCGSWGIR